MTEWGATLSRVFRVGLLRSIVSGRGGEAYSAYLDFARAQPDSASNRDVIRTAAELVESEYRHEYFYKNLLANRLLFNPAQSRDSALLMEVAVSSSILDALLIGNHLTAFEIKTELDSPSKVLKQIADYKKVAERVVIVTHLSLVPRYERLLGDEAVGLMAWRPNGTLSTIRDVAPDESMIDVRSIFNTLRKEEYSRITWRHTGSRPQVPNALLYEFCFDVIARMPRQELLREYSRELRTRGLRFSKEVGNPVLADIRSLCVQLNPSRVQVGRIIEWLEERPDVPSARSRKAI